MLADRKIAARRICLVRSWTPSRVRDASAEQDIRQDVSPCASIVSLMPERHAFPRPWAYRDSGTRAGQEGHAVKAVKADVPSRRGKIQDIE